MTYNKAAQAKYDAKCKVRPVKMFPETDKDIEAFLAQTKEPFATLVKRLIREEIAKQKSQNAEP